MKTAFDVRERLAELEACYADFPKSSVGGPVLAARIQELRWVLEGWAVRAVEVQ